jgi:hypothetical protein
MEYLFKKIEQDPIRSIRKLRIFSLTFVNLPWVFSALSGVSTVSLVIQIAAGLTASVVLWVFYKHIIRQTIEQAFNKLGE